MSTITVSSIHNPDHRSEEFLYELKAGPAGGRRRRPPATDTIIRECVVSGAQEGATAIQVGRIGLAGVIIGAIIGGIGSFSVTFFTLREQRQTQSIETRRTAYVAFSTKGQEYRQLLVDLVAEAAQKDQATYTKDRKRLASAGPALYSAHTNVQLVSGPELRDKPTAMTGALFSHPYIPRSGDAFNEIADAVLKAMENASKAMGEFMEAARADVLQE